MENKKGFIDGLNDLLIANGAGRYDHLRETPLMYVPIVNGADAQVVDEYVSHGANMVNITGDSLTGILDDLCRAGVL